MTSELFIDFSSPAYSHIVVSHLITCYCVNKKCGLGKIKHKAAVDLSSNYNTRLNMTVIGVSEFSNQPLDFKPTITIQKMSNI